jgi:hypothetical protein
MKITIQTIPHSQQRYPTVGDWEWNLNGLEIKVSELGNPYKELCVGIHELVEAFLCKKRGISQEDVDTFDINFEKTRQIDDTSEPGDDPKSPYKREHCFATGIERLLVSQFGINWKEYEELINSL